MVSDERDEEEAAKTYSAEQDKLSREIEVGAPRDFAKGEIVEGVVVATGDEGVAVDVGAKFEGLIPITEFVSEEELPAIDERIEVAVVHVDEENGVILLSKRRADYERIWRRLQEAQKTGEVMTAMVTERVKGGLRVDVGVPGFVPASQVAARSPQAIDRLVGRELRLRVLEVSQREKKVVLSHRMVVEEEREARKQETLARLHEGAVVEGRVRSLTNYGAFIDLGGIDGLLHVSEMSWVRVNNPAELLHVGQTVKVMVLSIEENGERISLGRRQILPDPWAAVGEKVKPGDTVRARITRVVRTGAFARLEGIEDVELEGFIPAREMPDRGGADLRDIVHSGQLVEAKVVDLHPESRRMTLSLAEAEQDRERQEYRQIMEERMSGTPQRTLGDAFRQAGLTTEQVQNEENVDGKD
ncbi:MAG: 30S ribosomal protein S1 [Armatimonadota bacterium]